MGKLTHTVSGNIASFRSADKLPIDALKVTLPIVQTGSGDPSPTNIRPLTAWTGVNVTWTGRNLLGGDAMKDMFMANNNNDTSRWKDDVRELWMYSSNAATGKVYFKGIFKENTQYTFMFKYYLSGSSVTAMNARIYYTDGTSENLNTLSEGGATETVVTVSAQGKTIDYIGGYKRNSYAARIFVDYSGIFEGVLTAQDFVAYNGRVIPVAWEVENGLYCGYVDLATGVITKTYGIISLWKCNWASTTVNTGIRRFYTSHIQNIVNPPINNSTAGNIYCPNYKTVPFYSLRDGTYDKCIAVSELGSVVIRDTTYTESDPVTTADEFEEILDGVYAVYELATPKTYQLTEQQLTALLDYNNVWSSAESNTEVTYEVVDHLDFLRKRMMMIMASGADFAKGSFTVPSNASSYKVEFGKTFSSYLYFIEMTDESKTALMNSGQSAAKMFACFGIYPPIEFDSSHTSGRQYASHRINPSNSTIDYSINAAAQAIDESSVTFGVGAFSGSANNLFRDCTYNYYVVEIK